MRKLDTRKEEGKRRWEELRGPERRRSTRVLASQAESS